jgi:hypothetical protein|tara:strand:+ start:1941 stop:2162 length:222 start_codon:yes stop_codon:yes gene_type:complete
MKQPQSKIWKTKAIYNHYEDASEIKSLLLENDDTGLLEVKIYRCGLGGCRFKIKTYMPEPKKKKKNLKKDLDS